MIPSIDTDTGGFPFVKLRLPEYWTLTQRATEAAKTESGEDKTDPAEPKVLRWTRNGCWIVGAGFAGGGMFLTAARVERWFDPDTSAIVWLIALMLLSAICANVAQVTINRRITLDAVREAREDLRAEIRDHAPADAIELARIATLVQQVAATQIKLAELIPLAVDEAARKAVATAVEDLRGELDEAIKRAKADAYVDALSGDTTVAMFPTRKRQDSSA